MRLQDRRVVAAVGVAAPDVEAAARLQARGPCCRTRRRAARRTPRRDTKSLASGRSLARSFLLRRLGLLGMPSEVELLVMRRALERADRPAAMALLVRGSTFTLYGGSVLTRWIAAPSSSRSTSSGLLLSPQSRRWSPRIHRSPGCVIASSGGSGTSSGSHQPVLHVRRPAAWPARPGSKPEQVQVEVQLLQVGQFDRQQVVVPVGERRRLVVGDAVGLDLRGRQVRRRRGPALRSRPSFSAAFQRVWPTMITPSSSTTIGWRKPNSRIDAATASTAASLTRGLFGVGLDVGQLPQLDLHGVVP